MSIGNIGGGNKEPFTSPEEGEKIKDQGKRKSFSGHDIDVSEKGVEDKASKLALSLPDLSEKISENSQRTHAHSDSDLEKEHIYDVPKSFEEPIYDIPKGIGTQEEIYDVPKSSKEQSDSTLQTTESKIGQATGFLSSTKDLAQESIYDVPSRPGESRFIMEEEPIYENIDNLLAQLGILSVFDYEQQQEFDVMTEGVIRSADECMNTCETLLENSTQTQGKESVKSKFSKLVSDIEKTCEKVSEKLSEWKIEFLEAWKKQFSIKDTSPTDIYYKQTTSHLLRERFKVPSVSLSSEAKQKLHEIAEKQNLDLQFLVSGDQTLIIMTAPETRTSFQRVQEKLGNFLSFLRSRYWEKVTSKKQPDNLDLVSEVLLSFLSLLTKFLQRVTDFVGRQRHFLEGISSQQALGSTYSLESGKSSLDLWERYKKTDKDSSEEDKRL